jgi:hypothetical protein
LLRRLPFKTFNAIVGRFNPHFLAHNLTYFINEMSPTQERMRAREKQRKDPSAAKRDSIFQMLLLHIHTHSGQQARRQQKEPAVNKAKGYYLHNARNNLMFAPLLLLSLCYSHSPSFTFI